MSPLTGPRSSRLALWGACALLVALVTFLAGAESWPPGTARAQTHSPPVFAANETGHRTIAENTPSRTDFGAPVSAEDPEGATVTYSLQAVGDHGAFSIDSASGQLATAPNQAFDFETRKIYVITVNARDPNGHGATRQITVRVTDIDEAPSITRSKPTLTTTDSTSLRRTELETGTVAEFTASDPEGSAVNWSLTGADADDFSINSAGELSFAVAPDINNATDSDADHIYNVNVVASDAQDNSVAHPVTVTIYGISGPREVWHNEGRMALREPYRLVNPPRELQGSETWQAGGTDGWRMRGQRCGQTNLCGDQTEDAEAKSGMLFFNNNEMPQFSVKRTYSINVVVGYYTENLNSVDAFGNLPVKINIRNLGGAAKIKGVRVHTEEENFTSGRTLQVEGPGHKTISLYGEDAASFHTALAFGNIYDLFVVNVPDFEVPGDSDSDNVYHAGLKVHNGTTTSFFPIYFRFTNNTAEPASMYGPQEIKVVAGSTGTIGTYTTRFDGTGATSFATRLPDGNKFNISSSGELSFKTAAEAAAGTYNLRVRFQAPGVPAVLQNVKVTVVANASDNDAPGAITGPDAPTVHENPAVQRNAERERRGRRDRAPVLGGSTHRGG